MNRRDCLLAALDAGARPGAEDATTWAGKAATSHNALLDLGLTIGLPGLVLTLQAFVWTPLGGLHRTVACPDNRRPARVLLGAWLFRLSLGSFEAYILARAERLWFLPAFAVCGLRCAARRRVHP